MRPESTASDTGASPARWLHLAEAQVVASWEGPERALRQLVDGLGASGAALLDMALEEPVVLARVDAGAPRPLLAVVSALAADPHRADGLVTGLVDGNPAGAVALNPETRPSARLLEARLWLGVAEHLAGRAAEAQGDRPAAREHARRAAAIAPGCWFGGYRPSPAAGSP